MVPESFVRVFIWVGKFSIEKFDIFNVTVIVITVVTNILCVGFCCVWLLGNGSRKLIVFDVMNYVGLYLLLFWLGEVSLVSSEVGTGLGDMGYMFIWEGDV